MEIDASKDVYLFVHQSDLCQIHCSSVAKGLVKRRSSGTAAKDLYYGHLWMPPNPDHIKIQQITVVDSSVEPKGMTGAWAGVSKDDLFTVKL